MAVLVVEVVVVLEVAKLVEVLVGTLVAAVEALVGSLVEVPVVTLAEAVEALVGTLVLEQVDQILVEALVGILVLGQADQIIVAVVAIVVVQVDPVVVVTGQMMQQTVRILYLLMQVPGMFL